jgi:glycosyltransferase involved in cell wall biosynthesis
VQPGDPARLAAALREVLGSPATATRLVQAGKARAAQLDWRVLAPEVLTWYESTAGPSSA